ncbi:hypothetical protein ACFQ08_02320 [Streptosporangium algeriense]|uniref:Uncharacterized protein n=1 Tax=Streptosporangium algeriense TaxID=1682748 RepID=A0ABW3DHP3_9ACTN
MLYSLSQRRFYGLCSWPAPQPVIVGDDTVEGLEERMREAETFLVLRVSPAARRRPGRTRRLRSSGRAA